MEYVLLLLTKDLNTSSTTDVFVETHFHVTFMLSPL